MFWDNFTELCDACKLTPNAVAKIVGVSSGSISAWKEGRLPRMSTMGILANFFGVSENYLLIGTKNKSFWETTEKELLNKGKNVSSLNEIGISDFMICSLKTGAMPNKKTIELISKFISVEPKILLEGFPSLKEQHIKAIENTYETMLKCLIIQFGEENTADFIKYMAREIIKRTLTEKSDIENILDIFK